MSSAELETTRPVLVPGRERVVTTKDGRRLRMRTIEGADEERLVAFHATLSEASIYFRFFSWHPRLAPEEVFRFTHVDGDARTALVVLDEDRIVAVGRCDRVGETSEAEVAFVVSDAYQHRGLATELLRALAEIARLRGIETFVAVTLPDNWRMRAVFTDAGFDVRSEYREGCVDVRFDIAGR
jgi:RimJ/RimL family protein N-acetyltransferase